MQGSKNLFHVKAEVEQHHSETCYTVKNLRVETAPPWSTTMLNPFVTKMEIKVVEKSGERLWVHCDSEKDSLLSAKAGQAIDNYLKNQADL